jgi:exodeoxyribonuclease VII large subunit
MAVPVRAELIEDLLGRERRLISAAARLLIERRTRLEGLGRGLPDAASLIGAAAQRLDDWSERFANSARATLKARHDHVTRLGYQLQPRALELLVKQGIRQSDALGERQARAMRQRLARHGEQKDALFRLLNNFSYERVLERGFVLVRDNRARPLTSAAALKPGMELALRFHDGEAAAVAAGRPKGGKERGSGGEDGEQGSLL